MIEDISKETAEAVAVLPPRAIDRAEFVPSLSRGASIVQLRKRLKDLGRPIYGLKNQMWQRLKEAEVKEAQGQELQRLLENRRRVVVESKMPYAPIALPAPQAPTADEVEKHRLCGHHLPKKWCEGCVRGRGQDDPHYRMDQSLVDDKPPCLELDYNFINVHGGDANNKESFGTLVALYDIATGLGIALSVPHKTNEMEYVVATVVAFIDSLGHFVVRIRTDGEPSIQAVATRLARARPRTLLETAPRYSSQSFGGVGSFQKRLIEDVRTLRSSSEMQLATEIDANHPVLLWLVRHAAW